MTIWRKFSGVVGIVHIPTKNLGSMFCFLVADFSHLHYLCRYCKFDIIILLLQHAPMIWYLSNSVKLKYACSMPGLCIQ